MPTVEPYKHDCEECTWVNWIVVDEDRLGNMYFCSNGHHAIGSVIIRFSDEPSDYWSAPIGAITKGPIGMTDNLYNRLTLKEGKRMKDQHAKELLRVCKRLLIRHTPEIEKCLRAEIITAVDQAERKQ